MCRLLVYKGHEPIKLSYWLIDAENSLLRQSEKDITNRPNPDGWGLVYRYKGKLGVVKNIKPAYLDKTFLPAAQTITGDTLFAHIRRRSHGPVLMENTHPFVHENKWIFMHNGNIPNFERCRNALSKNLPSSAIIQTQGTTDSEFLFKYFLYHFERSQNCNVYCVLNIIYDIISQLVSVTRPEAQPELALNFMLTAGDFVIGFRRNRSLFYTQMENGLLIASEPIDENARWNEVPEDHFVICDRPGEIKLVSYHVELSRKALEMV